MSSISGATNLNSGGGSSGGGGAWGDITGTLSDQTDLQSALNAKQPLDSQLTSIAGLVPGIEGEMITSDGLGGYQISTANDVRGYLNVENGATADQTAEEIKIAYESNADTNAFTDAEKTLLGNQSGVNTGDQDFSPAGSDTQIQFNNGGAFGASSGLVWDSTTGSFALQATSNADDNFKISNAAGTRRVGWSNSKNQFSIGDGGYNSSYGLMYIYDVTHSFKDVLTINKATWGSALSLNLSTSSPVINATGGSTFVNYSVSNTGTYLSNAAVSGGTFDMRNDNDNYGTYGFYAKGYNNNSSPSTSGAAKRGVSYGVIGQAQSNATGNGGAGLRSYAASSNIDGVRVDVLSGHTAPLFRARLVNAFYDSSQSVASDILTISGDTTTGVITYEATGSAPLHLYNDQVKVFSSTNSQQLFVGTLSGGQGYWLGRNTSTGFLDILGTQGSPFDGVQVTVLRASSGITINGENVVRNWSTTLGLGAGSGTASAVLEIRGGAQNILIGGGTGYSYEIKRNGGTGILEFEGQQAGYTGYRFSTASLSSALYIQESGISNFGADIDMGGNNIRFDDATGINDDSDNELLVFQKTASAVNYLEVTNASTGNGVTIGTAGGDTNIDLNIGTKGSGVINLNSNVHIGSGNTWVGIKELGHNPIMGYSSEYLGSDCYIDVSNGVSGSSMGVSDPAFIVQGSGDIGVHFFLSGEGKLRVNNKPVILEEYVEKTATYTAGTNDYVINCTANTFTITLPSTADIQSGKQYVIHNSGTGVITVDGDGSETIGGSASVTLAEDESITIVSDGSNFIIASRVSASSGSSYPIGVWTSSPTSISADTSTTFTHNLGITQADVEDGKYSVKLVGTTVVPYGIIYQSNSNVPTSWGLQQYWSSADTSADARINWQENTVKIYGPLALTDARLIVIQNYA